MCFLGRGGSCETKDERKREMEKRAKFHGSMPALVTPFKDGKFDEQAFRALVDWQISAGSHGLVPVGTTGEGPTLTHEEHRRVVDVCIDEARGRVPVIAGAGSNNTVETIELARHAEKAGADAALVVTPYYNKPSQAGLVEHYRACAKAHPGFPLVAYNVPGRTGCDLLPETCLRLCEIPEVVALKEATGSLVRAVDVREKCGDRLVLLSGDDFTVAPFIAVGGEGVISVSANVVPKKMADLVAAVRGGNRARARDLKVELNPLHRLLFIEPNPVPVKWALHLLGLFGPEIRLPLVALGEPHTAALAAELRRLGLSRA
jgi:4-hydroxy-tetrahydrodipicolinate synthase